MSNSSKLLSWVLFLSLFFFIAISLDISPYLRGPADSIIESRWPYYFVADTFSKAWVFIPIIIGFLIIINCVDKKRILSTKREWLILISIVLLTFLFQIALVYFSRFGITVLFRRLVDPGINGYFTEAIKINDLKVFLATFPDLINGRTMAQHASGHPPAALLLLKFLTDSISLIPINLVNFLSSIQPGWARELWENLTLHQKLASLVIPFLLHLFSSMVVIPFYFVSKNLFKDTQIAFKTTILFSVIPSLSFFALIFDPIYAAIPLIATLLIQVGLKKNKSGYFFFAGVICGIGLFATAAILTYLFGLFVVTALSYKKVLVKHTVKFVLGILYVFLLLYLMSFNLVKSLIAVIHNQASREYFPWLIYNPYDFFVFMGLPISIAFLYLTFLILKRNYQLPIPSQNLFLTFWITFGLLVISGASRGEVGRIWLPFMFAPILVVGSFINNLNFSKKQFILLFTLIFIQTILLEEFWVPIW